MSFFRVQKSHADAIEVSKTLKDTHIKYDTVGFKELNCCDSPLQECILLPNVERKW